MVGGTRNNGSPTIADVAKRAGVSRAVVSRALSPEPRPVSADKRERVLEAAAAKGNAEQRKLMVTAPENVQKMLIINEEQAAHYSAKYENEWNRMQLG